MQTIFNFIFDNFLLVVVIVLGWYIFTQYKDLKEKTNKIKDLFTKVLSPYLDEKINEAKTLAEEIKNEYNGVKIYREAIVSYPDKVFAYNVSAQNGTINFDARLFIPYLDARPIEEGGRTGEITACGNTLVMRGTLPSRELIYEARLTVRTDGELFAYNDKLTVKNATIATLFYTLDTSYKLCPEVFFDDGHYEMKPSVDLGLTIDERLADGYYYSRTVKLLKTLLENPELLEKPLCEEVEF